MRARITGDRLETRTSLEDRQISTLVEAYGLFLGDGRRHELSDSVEDRLELGIILPLKVLQFLGQLMIGRKDGPKADNARMISMFTCTAWSLRSTLESMATPSWVKA